MRERSLLEDGDVDWFVLRFASFWSLMLGCFLAVVAFAGYIVGNLDFLRSGACPVVVRC